jgi:hypothetical protein
MVHSPIDRSCLDLQYSVVTYSLPGWGLSRSVLSSRRSEQSSNLLVAFDSTVIFGFGLRRNPWPYFCSFQDHLRVLRLGLLFLNRRICCTLILLKSARTHTHYRLPLQTPSMSPCCRPTTKLYFHCCGRVRCRWYVLWWRRIVMGASVVFMWLQDPEVYGFQASCHNIWTHTYTGISLYGAAVPLQSSRKYPNSLGQLSLQERSAAS